MEKAASVKGPLLRQASTSEKSLKIQEPVQSLQTSLEDLTPVQTVLDVVKSLHRLTEDINETVSLTGSCHIQYKVAFKLLSQVDFILLSFLYILRQICVLMFLWC